MLNVIQTCSTNIFRSVRPTSTISRCSYESMGLRKVDYLELQDIGHFRIMKPLPFLIERLDDGVILSNKESNLVAFGATLEDAKADLEVELQMAWEEIAMEDDLNMDAVACDRKEWLLANVRRCD